MSLSSSIPFSLSPAVNDRAARVSMLLLVVLIAATVADLTWRVLEPRLGAQGPVTLPAAAPGGARHERGQPNGERLAGLHLFGVAQSSNVQAAKPVEAPDTRLRLTLKGVVAHDDPERARAIVANAGGREEAYAVGQEIESGAVLREVRTDRVLLERTGRYETLRLPEKSTGGLSVEVHAASRGATRGESAGALGNIPDSSLRDIRDAFIENPQTLGQYLRAVPVQRNGEFKGFRVMAGNKTHLLDKLGLRRGDIVTEVNGVAMDSQLKGLEALSAITEAQSSVQVTVLRDGSPQVLTFSLD